MSEMSITGFWQSVQIPPINIQPPPPSHLKMFVNKVFPFIDHAPKKGIDDLPADMMMKIIRYVRQEELPQVALTCKAFRVYVQVISLNTAEAVFLMNQEACLLETFGPCFKKSLLTTKDAYELLAETKKLIRWCSWVLLEYRQNPSSSASLLEDCSKLKLFLEETEECIFESRFVFSPYLPQNTSLEMKAAIVQNVLVIHSRDKYLFDFRGYNFVPRQIYCLSSLRVLDLARGMFSKISSDIHCLRELEELYLSENRFAVFPSAVVALSTLQVLDVSYNQIKKIPHKIALLRTLQKLNLSHNELSSLPPAIGQLTALQELDLENDPLSSLPPMEKLVNLRLLVLGGTNLSQAAVNEVMQCLPPGCWIHWALEWHQIGAQ